MPKTPNLPARTRGAPKKAIQKRKRKAREDRPLTAQQQLFVTAYMVRFNATRAYMDSYPNASWATADSGGSRLMADRRISSEINRLLAQIKKRHGHSAVRTLDTLSILANSSISDVFDEHGTIMQPNKMPREISLAVKKLKRVERKAMIDGVDQVIGHTVELEMADKVAPLRLLGQHYNLFTEKVLLSADDELLRALELGAARALQR